MAQIPNPILALPALIAAPHSISSRGGAAPRKRYELGPCGLWRPVRARLAALAGLPLQRPEVPLRGRPGGPQLGAHGRTLLEQQVGGAPRGCHGGSGVGSPGKAGGAGALGLLAQRVMEAFLFS